MMNKKCQIHSRFNKFKLTFPISSIMLKLSFDNFIIIKKHRSPFCNVLDKAILCCFHNDSKK